MLTTDASTLNQSRERTPIKTGYPHGGPQKTTVQKPNKGNISAGRCNSISKSNRPVHSKLISNSKKEKATNGHIVEIEEWENCEEAQIKKVIINKKEKPV